METINAVLKAMRRCGTTARQIAGVRGREDRRLVLTRLFLLFLPICFQGCAVPRLGPRPSATKDHAFITYWPAGNETGKLRLAVKDVIDMKGEVTTAGSQYLAGTNKPAARDAKCLGPARRGAGDAGVSGKARPKAATGTPGEERSPPEFFGSTSKQVAEVTEGGSNKFDYAVPRKKS